MATASGSSTARNCKQLILDMIDQQIERHLDEFLDQDYGAATFAQWAGSSWPSSSRPATSRGSTLPPPQRHAADEALRMAEGQVSTRSTKTCPRTKNRASGTGKRWPSWSTPAGS